MNSMLKIAYDYGRALAEKEAALPLAAIRDMTIGGALGGLGGAAISDEENRFQGIGAGVLAGLVPGALARSIRSGIINPVGYERALDAVQEKPLRSMLMDLPKIGKKFDEPVKMKKLEQYYDEVRHLDPLRTFGAVGAPWAISGAAGLGTALGVNNILED